MFKKAMLFGFMVLMSLNMCSCAALLIGGATGAGTAVWLSDKLTQQVNASYERTINAAEATLKSLNLEIVKEVKGKNVTQLRSNYTDGKDIWIDVRKITKNSTKIEVRVGAVSPDKEAADRILKTVQDHL